MASLLLFEGGHRDTCSVRVHRPSMPAACPRRFRREPLENGGIPAQFGSLACSRLSQVAPSWSTSRDGYSTGSQTTVTSSRSMLPPT